MPDASDIPAYLLTEDEELATRNHEIIGEALQEATFVSSTAAEQYLLGALILDGLEWDNVSRIVSPSDFCQVQHQEIFRAVAALGMAHTPIDIVTLSQMLQETRKLDVAGGMPYLIRLARETAVSAHAAEYARIVREKALRRDLAKFGRSITADIMGGLDSREVLASIKPRVEALSADIEDRNSLRVKPMNWRALKDKPRPERKWAVDHWLGMGYVTLMAGAGGLGKTLVAQTIAACLAVGQGFVDRAPSAVKVLMLAGEDEEEELHARQIDICEWLGIDFEAIADNLILASYKRRDMTIAEAGGRGPLLQAPFWGELKAQIGDYGAQYVVLDSSARTFGGNENDRHHVTQFVTWLEAACEPTNAGLLLLAHPAKDKASEFSGSTAWEASVRSRLYLGRTLPAEEPQEDEVAPPDDGTRYLCRRKANYSDRDWRKLNYVKGVLIPEQVAGVATSFTQRYGGTARKDDADTAIVEGIKRLQGIGMHGRAAPTSPEYLPKKLLGMQLAGGFARKELAEALNRLLLGGRIREAEVGKLANRTPRMGLVLAEGTV